MPTEPTNRPKRLLLNVGSSMFGQIVGTVLSVVGTAVTARWLGAGGRGELSLFTSATMLTVGVIAGGVGPGITALTAQGRLWPKSAVRIQLAVAALTVVLLCAGGAIAHFAFAYRIPAWGYALPLGVLAAIMSGGQISLALGVGRVDHSVVNNVLTSTLMVAGYAVSYALLGRAGVSVMVAIAVWIGSQIAGDVVGWVLVLRSPEVRALPRMPVPFRALAHFAGAAYLGVLIGQLNFRADILILGGLATKAQVGVYSIATVAASLVMLLPTALGQALNRPFGTASHERGRALLRRGSATAFYSAVVSGALAALALPFVVPWVLGNEFAAVTGLVLIMLPGMVLFAPAHVSSVYYSVVLSRPLLATRVAAAALIVDVPLLLVLGPTMGATGAAIASSVSFAAAGIVNFAQLHRYGELPFSSAFAIEAGDLEILRDFTSFLRGQMRGGADE